MSNRTDRKMMAKKRNGRMDTAAKEDADRILEGYRKGGHTCKECGRVFISLCGCEVFRDKVRALLSKELPGFEWFGAVFYH